MASKSVVYDYVENASKEAKELIAKFELEGDQEMLVKALLAAYCRGVDAVDGYLRNSLSAYRTSVKNQQWISVNERLPEEGEYVLLKCKDSIFYSIAFALREFWDNWGVTHWMPLPEPPKEEK